MGSDTLSSPAKHNAEGVSSTGAVADSRVASATGGGTAETGIEVDSARGEINASTGKLVALGLLMTWKYVFNIAEASAVKAPRYQKGIASEVLKVCLHPPCTATLRCMRYCQIAH